MRTVNHFFSLIIGFLKFHNQYILCHYIYVYISFWTQLMGVYKANLRGFCVHKPTRSIFTPILIHVYNH